MDRRQISMTSFDRFIAELLANHDIKRLRKIICSVYMDDKMDHTKCPLHGICSDESALDDFFYTNNVPGNERKSDEEQK